MAFTGEGSHAEAKTKIPQLATDDARSWRCRRHPGACGAYRRRRSHWQTIFEGRDKPSLYRLYNGIPADAEDAGNAMIVEVDGAKQTIEVSAGTSVDVFGKRIRVKAAGGGDTLFVEGWYILVS